MYSRPSKEELNRVTAVLNSLVEDRTILGDLDIEERKALMTAAGRLSRPDRLEIMKTTKRYRKREHQLQKATDRRARAATTMRTTRALTEFRAPERQLNPPGILDWPELSRPNYCYICKSTYSRVHFFYDALCPACSALNYEKRFQSARLDGKVALITGARVKIGFQAALMMLRSGARVMVTTRFPVDAATRYSRVEDFDEWGDRLEVHGLDLRHSPSVECFANSLSTRCERLDILINNAAQTVKRPRNFYEHLLEAETSPRHLFSSRARKVLAETSVTPIVPQLSPGGSDWLSLLEEGQKGLFPSGKLDADLQQVDLRKMNSWRMTLADVPTPEMLEVQLINSVAPFILCSRLKPLMLRVPTGESHIVNVSAMEGKFARFTKTDKHPHTNMAKAALNMMTLTSAPDYAKDGIFMNAVDTGWVTDEDPIQHSVRKREEHDFEPPLDIVDGAARVCDPFFSGLLTGNHVWGKFLKDYEPTSW